MAFAATYSVDRTPESPHLEICPSRSSSPDWKRRGEPAYIDGLLEEGSSPGVMPGEKPAGSEDEDEESDALYDEAVHYVTKSRRASISSVQRKLRIGYNRAARLIETMEASGVVSEMGSNGQREVLAPPPVED